MASPSPIHPSTPRPRAEPAELRRQVGLFADRSPLLIQMLDAVPDIVMALNEARQIVFANHRLAELSSVELPDTMLWGLRPGEAIHCVRAAGRDGCGGSEFCGVCGLAQTLATDQPATATEREWRLNKQPNDEAVDLRVSSTLHLIDGERFTVVVLSDISHEKRRRALERVFFHDVLNTVTAMRAATQLLQRAEYSELDRLPDMLARQVERLIEEISSQRQLTDAENGELVVNWAVLDAAHLVSEVAAFYQQEAADRGRTLYVDVPSDVALPLRTDATLLRRVLSNMLKNAIEAGQPGDVTTVGCRAHAGQVEFWTHNPGQMPRAVQLQVFQRSFSTKGSGRGLGTYSMKLLSERYLHGAITFSSHLEQGTIFTATFPLAAGASLPVAPLL